MGTLRPIMLGIGGDSGTGKSTLVGGLYKLFGTEQIASINLDDYHTFDRAQRKIYGLTALHPAANNIALMAKHAWQLRNGETIIKPVYDHSTGTFAEPERVEPKPLVLINGLFPFFTQELREAFDLKVYLDPDPELKLAWKVRRDVGKRGYTVEQVLQELQARQEDIRKYIEPQKEYADLIVRFYPPKGYAEDPDDTRLNVRLFLSQSLPKTDLDGLLREAVEARSAIRLADEDYEGQPFHLLEIDGTLSPEKAGALEQKIWSHLLQPMRSIRDLRPEQFGRLAEGDGPRQSTPLALVQLLLIYYLLQAREARAGGLDPIGAMANFREEPSRP